MSGLILLLLLCNLTFICCRDSSLTLQDDMRPRGVKFQSLDYRNILYWKHPTSHQIFQYSVQYKVYGDKHWTDAKHCQSISISQCDLSQETSDPREWYYARVQSTSEAGQSPWVISARFHPQAESNFSPPQLKLNGTERGIVVRVKPPRTPYRRQNGTRISVLKLQKLIFRIYVMHNEVEEEIHEMESCTKELLIQGLRPKTTYCLQAQTVIPRFGRTSSKGLKTCVTTL
ncbi:interleukin-22 receptor subunit alpha-2 [Chanos chanos]|uniref:Interleukin-22 receptor subunit alpha-2 n=1 Tax=Chanos chanos TaxID=29144 RepID=A0A6J2V726_CHACN|nr:interleukin-22 receptor subunit alpha-2-like [Chanos chanos]